MSFHTLLFHAGLGSLCSTKRSESCFVSTNWECQLSIKCMYVFSHNELSSTCNTSTTGAELSTTGTELSTTSAELSTTYVERSLTSAELSTTSTELINCMINTGVTFWLSASLHCSTANCNNGCVISFPALHIALTCLLHMVCLQMLFSSLLNEMGSDKFLKF